MIRLRRLWVRDVLSLGEVRLGLADRGLVALVGEPGSGRSALATALKAAVCSSGPLPVNAHRESPDPLLELELAVGDREECRSSESTEVIAGGALVVLDLESAAAVHDEGRLALEWALAQACGVDLWEQAIAQARRDFNQVQGELTNARDRIAAARPSGLPVVLENRATLRSVLKQAKEASDLAQADVEDRRNAIRSLDVRIAKAREELAGLESLEQQIIQARAARAQREESLVEIESLEARIPDDSRGDDFDAAARKINLRHQEAVAAAELPRRSLETIDLAQDDRCCPGCLRPIAEPEIEALRAIVQGLDLDVAMWASRVESSRWTHAIRERVRRLKDSVGPETEDPGEPKDLERIAGIRSTIQALLEERDRHAESSPAVEAAAVAAVVAHGQAQAEWDLAQQVDALDSTRAAEAAGWFLLEKKLEPRARRLQVAIDQVFPELVRSALARGVSQVNERLARWMPWLTSESMQYAMGVQGLDLVIRDRRGAVIQWSYLSAAARRACALARHLAIWDVACQAGLGPDLLLIDDPLVGLDRARVMSVIESLDLRNRTLVVVCRPEDELQAKEYWRTELVDGVTSVRPELA